MVEAAADRFAYHFDPIHLPVNLDTQRRAKALATRSTTTSIAVMSAF
jgi:hypothetical protein